MTRPELDRLIAQEIERHLGRMGDSTPESEVVRRVTHSLKGSAAMAGHHDLALLVTQLDGRLRQQDPTASQEAVEHLRRVASRLRQGRPAFTERWPEPPAGLRPSVVEPRLRQDYVTAMFDRLAELDHILAEGTPDLGSVEHCYRIVHSLKGAAGSVGDDSTAWYCHELENRVRTVLESQQGIQEILTDLTRHRATLGRLLDNPNDAFEMLRSAASRRPMRKSAAPPPMLSPYTRATPRPLAAAGSEDQDPELETPLRVPVIALDHLFDHLERLELTSTNLLESAGRARRVSRVLGELRVDLLEVRQQLGPPKPWGASARTLNRLATAIDHLLSVGSEANLIELSDRQRAHLLRSEWNTMRRDLDSLRRVRVGWLFDRLERAGRRWALSENKRIRVETRGSELTLDRPLAERIIEPLLQLVRNAIGHGIETPERRMEGGKPIEGVLRLFAERRFNRLSLVIEDDGRGVDLSKIRELALDRRLVDQNVVGRLRNDELIELLFLPGLSTRNEADFLAGRGVGLNLAEDLIERLGGSIHLSLPRRGGFRARIDLPCERGIVKVLWVRANQVDFALPVGSIGTISEAAIDSPPFSLAACVGMDPAAPPRIALQLLAPAIQPSSVGIDEVGRIEEVLIRPLPLLLARTGPYLGAVLRGDGHLRLVLDAALLLAKAVMADVES